MSQPPNAIQSPFASQPQYPALYLYPINDSFVPKHILLHNSLSSPFGAAPGGGQGSGGGQRVKIGRQTNAKTGPGERNGYFDSKVLSRQHAEVWAEPGKIFIRDVKSSNGTFVNGERLSPEGVESDPFELKTHDIVEFGIDIMAEDNKTIVHHKVAARAFCVLSDADLQAAMREEQQRGMHMGNGFGGGAGGGGGGGGGGAGSGFNFSGNGQHGGQNQGQRRTTSLQQQALSTLSSSSSPHHPSHPMNLLNPNNSANNNNGAMGSMGASSRPPGSTSKSSGLTFDHILSRLHGELQKSRETGAELHSVTGSVNEVLDTLGGVVHAQPPNAPVFPQTLPPVRVQPLQPAAPAPAPAAAPPPPDSAPSTTAAVPLVPDSGDKVAVPPVEIAPKSNGENKQGEGDENAKDTKDLYTTLQSQLEQTKSLLSEHVAKTREWEEVVLGLKREVGVLRGVVGDSGLAVANAGGVVVEDGSDVGERREEQREEEGYEGEREQEQEQEHEEAQDDRGSVHTLRELERVEEEDETETETEAEAETATLVDRDDADPFRQEDDREPQEEEDEEEEEEEETYESRSKRREELGRPRTPGLGLLGAGDDDEEDGEGNSSVGSTSSISSSADGSVFIPIIDTTAGTSTTATAEKEQDKEQHEDTEELKTRLRTLSTQLENAIAISGELQAQHLIARGQIEVLEGRVRGLEGVLAASVVSSSSTSSGETIPAVVEEPEEIVSKEDDKDAEKEQEEEDEKQTLSAFKSTIEAQFAALRAEWAKEREEWSVARKKWEDEAALRNSSSAADVPTRASVGEHDGESSGEDEHDGKAHEGGGGVTRRWLPTPPSSRGYSSDAELREMVETTTPVVVPAEAVTPNGHVLPSVKEIVVAGVDQEEGQKLPMSPESSVRSLDESAVEARAVVSGKEKGVGEKTSVNGRPINPTTIIGVLVISIVTASVLWRVKPE